MIALHAVDHTGAPVLRHALQHARVAEVLLNKGAQRFAVHPLHLDDGKPLALNPNALIQIFEINQRIERILVEMSAEQLIAAMLIFDLAQKAAHSPTPPATIDLIDGGE